MSDPHDAPTPRYRNSATWALRHDDAVRLSEQCRELALTSLDLSRFDIAKKARDLQLKGVDLAAQTDDWKRLDRENPYRQAAIAEIFAYEVAVEMLLKEAAK